MKSHLVTPSVSLVLFLLFLLLCPTSASAEEVQAAARQAALTDFAKMIEAYRQPRLNQFAIDNMKLDSIDQLSRAVLGEPYKVYKMSSKDAATISDDPASVFSHAIFIYYEFPIVIDESCHGVIRVAENEGLWEAIGGGGKEEIYDYLIDTKSLGTRSMIEMDGDATFAVISREGACFLIPANKSSATALGVSEYCKLVPYKDAIRALKQYSSDKNARSNR